jgi:hypothetical protein
MIQPPCKPWVRLRPSVRYCYRRSLSQAFRDLAPMCDLNAIACDLGVVISNSSRPAVAQVAVCYHPFPTNPVGREVSAMQPHLIQIRSTGTFYPAAAHSTPLAPQHEPGRWNARHAARPNLDLTCLVYATVLAYA